MQIINGKAFSTVDDTQILGFFGGYGFLSNFHSCPVEVDGLIYPSSEHAFMAQKTDLAWERKKLACGIPTPKEAKTYGQSVTLRKDWEEVKYSSMVKVLYAKFSQNEELGDFLIGTGTRRLEETNWWGDKYWGVCNKEGQNKLGLALMEVRDSIRNDRDLIPLAINTDQSKLIRIYKRLADIDEFVPTDYSVTCRAFDYNGPDGVLKALVVGEHIDTPIGNPRTIEVFIDPTEEDHRPETPQAVLMKVVIHPSITDLDLERRLRIFVSSLMQGK